SRFVSHHIPYGIDLDHFRPGTSNRAAFGLPEHDPIILHVAWPAGRDALNLRKGLPDLREAFIDHVLPLHPRARLAVAGDSFAPNLPNVLPLGMVGQDRLPELLRSVDVFVTATLADNLPYTVLEAMACGIPVVGTSVGGVPEQIVEGVTGHLAPPSNP